MANLQNEKKKKIVIIGDGGVGKSSLIQLLHGKKFNPKYIPTLGLNVEVLGCKYVVWDFSGQARFGAQYESMAHADFAIIMFDLTSKRTYTNVKSWIDMVHKQCGDIPYIVCGNKMDCECRVVFETDIPYVEISVKNNVNVEKVFNFTDELKLY